MLSKLAGIHGKAFGREVLGPGLKDVKTGFVVTPNGLLMGQLRGVDTKLSEDDSIILRARAVDAYSFHRTMTANALGNVATI